MKDIWILSQHRKGVLDDVSFGLIGEARRLLSREKSEGIITAITLGYRLSTELERLGQFGADRVLYMEDEKLSRFQSDLYAEVLFDLLKRERPYCLMVCQAIENADMSPRLAARLGSCLITHVCDLKVDEEGRFVVTRSVANDYLFEEVRIEGQDMPVISFLSSVLTTLAPEKDRKAEIHTEPLMQTEGLSGPRVIRVMESDQGDMNIEEAEYIVAAGRGVGKGKAFEIINELAQAIGASVAGTRPVIDWQMLPYERQIGQTGRSVGPRLIINCGISGANEYTAGMEMSRLVIAINSDPVARIFRFADLGVIGDVHKVLPLLISRIKKLKAQDLGHKEPGKEIS